MRWIMRLVRWLLRISDQEEEKHNPADFNIGMLRFSCNELLANFTAFAETCWAEGRKDELEQLQLLASWFSQELRKSVGHPPTIN